MTRRLKHAKAALQNTPSVAYSDWNAYFVDEAGNTVDLDTYKPNMPYLMLSDSTDQAIASTSANQLLSFDTTEGISGITKTSATRFTFPTAGTYLITFSGIADLTLGANAHIELWIAVDGTPVPRSNTRVQLPAASVEYTVAVSFLYTFTASQYLEFYTWGDSTSVQWEATAAAGGRPAAPSVIVTMNMVSAN